MTKQTWTAAVSALIFVLCAAIVAVSPVPFVTKSPGQAVDLLGSQGDQPIVTVEGVESYPATGRLYAGRIAVTPADNGVSLPEAMYAYWAADREVFPREAVYPEGSTASEIAARDAQLMANSQLDATAAALRAAGMDVRQIPMVQSVASAGPAVDKLFPGDFVLGVNGVATPTVASVRDEVEKRGIGEAVTFTVLRDREQVTVTIDLAASKTQAGVPVWGGNLVMGYSYEPRAVFHLDSAVGGSSAGLLLALAVFERVTPESLVGDRVIAGTGAIDGAGNVTAVADVRPRLASAEEVGASVFLVPAANCGDLEGRATTVRIVSVTSLDDAINALDALADPSTEALVRGCS